MKISTMTFANDKNKVEIIDFLNATHEDVRSAAQALSPVLLKSQGLSKILEEYFQKLEDFNLDLAIEYNFQFLSSTLQSPHEEILYLTCLELINNAIRHGKTNYLRIQLTEDSNNYRLEVEDRGIGFHTNEAKFGFGLKSIEQRAAFLNGYFEIKRQDLGTTCIFEITKN
jgi:two-component system sensor histidine kinase DegS